MSRTSRVFSAASLSPSGNQDSGLLTRRGRLLWTVGNLCMLLGIVVLLYVGGLYVNDEYGRYAARGDTDVPAPMAIGREESTEPAPFTAQIPTVAPTANAAQTDEVQPIEPELGQAVAPPPALPTAVPAPPHRSLVTRLKIPSIALDAKVIEVGWEMQDVNGAQVPVWQVANYAVGQHQGSANPGEGENIVLAGHVGGYGYVFRDLYYVHPGDSVTLYSDGKEYNYTVKERLIVDEENVPPEQKAENAELIAPQGEEMVTMVTCWPSTGANKFTQRVVIRAVPS